MAQLGLIATALASAVGTIVPLQAPAIYATPNYGLTFRTPPGSLYCPLPPDWAGSDHGTVLFLAAPGRCSGAGYPSSSRAAERNVPRIEIFYSYWTEEDAEFIPPERCIRVATAWFLGKERPLCAATRNGRLALSVKAQYRADTTAQAIFTLVTNARRLKSDLAAFQAVIASTQTCSSVWNDGKRSFTIGEGPRCPDGTKWF